MVPLVFYCDENSLLVSEKVRRFDLLLISHNEEKVQMNGWAEGV